MNRRITATIAIVLTAGALTACGSSDEESPTATTAPTTTTTEATPSESFDASPSNGAPAESSAADASASPAPDEAPFPADTSTDTGTASADAQLVLVDVRTGSHDGFDRVVMEFDGPGAPGWTAQYADAASRQGSGEAITVAGTAILDVQVNGTTYPAEGAPTFSFGPVTAPGTSVQGIFYDGTFEGLTHIVLGTDGEQPFRVFSLADPARVVIDVQH